MACRRGTVLHCRNRASSLLGIAVLVASLTCFLNFSMASLTASTEIEVKVPTWDVKHDIGCPKPEDPLEDLHCDVGDVRFHSHLPILAYRLEISRH